MLRVLRTYETDFFPSSPCNTANTTAYLIFSRRFFKRKIWFGAVIEVGRDALQARQFLELLPLLFILQ